MSYNILQSIPPPAKPKPPSSKPKTPPPKPKIPSPTKQPPSKPTVLDKPAKAPPQQDEWQELVAEFDKQYEDISRTSQQMRSALGRKDLNTKQMEELTTLSRDIWIYKLWYKKLMTQMEKDDDR